MHVCPLKELLLPSGGNVSLKGSGGWRGRRSRYLLLLHRTSSLVLSSTYCLSSIDRRADNMYLFPGSVVQVASPVNLFPDLTAILTAKPVKNCCHWREGANQK